MSGILVDFTLNRAGWGVGHSLELDVRMIESARDPSTLPNLLRVKTSEPLADMLLWPERSGCALQCQYAVTSSGRNASHTLVAAEAVKRNGNGEMFEIELVEGWLQVPRYWGNRCLHDEEVEAAVYGMASNGELQMLSIPAEHDTYDAPRPRILKSPNDAAVLFIAATTEEARILADVVERLCETGALVQRTSEAYPFAGSSMAGTEYRRTDKRAPPVTRWLGGHGTRSQQALELRAGAPWSIPMRWSGVSP